MSRETQEPLRSIEDLRRGDIVQNKNSGLSYVVESVNLTRGATALRSVTVTNPSGWLLVRYEEEGKS